MADVGDVNLVVDNRIKNKIAQPGSDDHASVCFVRRSTLEWIVSYFSRSFDKASDNTRSDIRIILTDVSVDLSEVSLRGLGKSNPHS
jgi:hypothetical protein